MRIPAFVFSLSLLSGPAFADQGALNEKLHEAVQFQDQAAVTAALTGGADPNSVNRIGLTPLMRAIQMRQVEFVQQLLDAGADPNKGNAQGTSPAELAIEGDNAEIVEALVKAGANFNVNDVAGNSLVMATILAGGEAMYEILAVLGRHGVDMDQGNPLYFAVSTQPNLELARTLLEAGADPSLATEHGHLPLAAALDDPEMVDLLLAAGADPNGIDADGNPVLFGALFSYSVPRETVEALIAAGADVNKPGADGRTALERASIGGDQEELVALLKRHGATDGKEAADEKPDSPPEPAAATAATAPEDKGEAPRVMNLPVYPNVEATYPQEEDNVVSFITTDPVPQVSTTMVKLMETAGWHEANHSHSFREEDHHHLIFTREGPYVLMMSVALARGMGNKTSIGYSIIEKKGPYADL